MKPVEGFADTVDAALSYVEQEPALSTIGIPPSRPETGYGYLELSETLGEGKVTISKLNSFKEKPSLETAKSYLDSGNYLWNSGMFFWRMDTFSNQMIKHLPEVGEQIQA